MKNNKSPRVGIICGGGGYTTETLLLIKNLSLDNFRFIIAGGLHFDNGSYHKIMQSFSQNERVITVENPMLISITLIEKIIAHLLNIVESFAIILLKKFNILFGIGSYLCLPLFMFAKLKGIKCIYMDSYTRTHDLSLTGKLIYKLKLANKFYVLHTKIHKKYPKTIFIG